MWENDPSESFLKSIQVSMNAISQIELNFRNFAKNFEHYINGFVKNANFVKNTVLLRIQYLLQI